MAEENNVQWKPFVAMIAINFAFAVVNVLLKKVLSEGVNHLVLITYRLSISAIFLAPVCYFLERNNRPKLTSRILCFLFFSSIVGASLPQYLFLLGIQHTSATFACAFLNMVPVITFLMALLVRIETVDTRCNSGRAKIAGSLVCIIGAVTLTLYRGTSLFDHSHSHSALPNTHVTNLESAKSTERWVLSSMALFFGTLLWSSWFLLQSYVGKIYPCKYSSTAFMSFFGAVQSAASASLSPGRSLSVWVLTSKVGIFTVLFSGMIGSGLCYAGMSWCVKKRGPVFTSAFSPLAQIIAAMFDITILHEQLHLGSVLGSALVIVGLYLLLWGKNKEMHEVAEKAKQPDRDIKEQEHSVEVVV